MRSHLATGTRGRIVNFHFGNWSRYSFFFFIIIIFQTFDNIFELFAVAGSRRAIYIETKASSRMPNLFLIPIKSFRCLDAIRFAFIPLSNHFSFFFSFLLFLYIIYIYIRYIIRIHILHIICKERVNKSFELSCRFQ